MHHAKCNFCGKPTLRHIKRPLSFCDNTCKGEWQKLQRPVSVEWLRQKYIVEKLDCTQISKLVGRDSKSVWNWLSGSGIETRKRGTTGNFKGHIGYWNGRKHSEETKKKLSDIAKADGRVPFHREVGSYMRGRSGSDTPNWKGGITPDRQAVYSSIEWSNAVKAVWKRDDATCQKCRNRKNEHRDIPFDIHHIVSFESKDLRTTVSNLVLLCEPCHYWVHSRKNENKEFIQENNQ